MTSNLFGRWQTRLLLFATVGFLVSLPFYFGFIAPESSKNTDTIYFWVLFYIALFGFGWDIVYIYLQRLRWDRDWPAILQLLTGIWEAIFFLWLVKLQTWLPVLNIPFIPPELPVKLFALHYSVVWLTIFIASQSLMRILFPGWRFRGGQWW